MQDTKTQHTPGPWEVSKHGTPESFPQWGIYAAESDQRSHDDHAIVKGDTQEQAEANARLIAAAPALLEACEAIVRADANAQPWTEPRYGDALKLVVAAIAQAKGT